MSVSKSADGWMQFEGGKPWRCKSPHFFCEVGQEGYIPQVRGADLAIIRRVRNFYETRSLVFGKLNARGTALDILVANAMTESFGTVPSPLEPEQLRSVADQAPGSDPAARLDAVVRHILHDHSARWLARKEPRYINPLATPDQVSLGAHHQLLSTALNQPAFKGKPRNQALEELVYRLPSQSLLSAELAIGYFNNCHHRHNNEPPLLAACYNAGSLRKDARSDWHLHAYGNHIDRWVMFYNTSRALARPHVAPSVALPVLAPQKVATKGAGLWPQLEQILALFRSRNYMIREDDTKNFQLNLLGIRNPQGQPNAFNDTLVVFWKYQGVWQSRRFTITTVPGKTYLAEKLMNPRGTAILKEGQYPGSHRIGLHKGLPALVQCGKLTVYRDKNLDGKLDMNPATLQTGAGFRVDIHQANAHRTSVQVDSWSAGCQVFASPIEFKEFMDLSRSAGANGLSTFTYTLASLADFA